MAKNESALRRLGGGRWETRDGRFAIEPQSGTWMIVDAESIDELGLPLVRGPFASLTSAKEAIAAARTQAPSTSPLADKLRAAKAEPPAPRPGRRAGARSRAPATSKPPSEPKWLTDLGPPDRRRAMDLIGRLEKAGIDDAERIARDEVAHSRPAVVRAALIRRLGSIADHAGGEDSRRVARAVAAALLDGADRSLGVRWRLVDGDGREIGELDLPE